jgi:hypothetical protein
MNSHRRRERPSRCRERLSGLVLARDVAQRDAILGLDDDLTCRTDL